jgi:hypothetical protein
MGSASGKSDGQGATGETHQANNALDQSNSILSMCCIFDRDLDVHDRGRSIKKSTKRVSIKENANSAAPNLKRGFGSEQDKSDYICEPAIHLSDDQLPRFAFKDLPKWTSAEQQQLEHAVLSVASSRSIKPPGVKEMQKIRAAQSNDQTMSIDDSRSTYCKPSNIASSNFHHSTFEAS